jgi:hypothetical protein
MRLAGSSVKQATFFVCATFPSMSQATQGGCQGPPSRDSLPARLRPNSLRSRSESRRVLVAREIVGLGFRGQGREGDKQPSRRDAGRENPELKLQRELRKETKVNNNIRIGMGELHEALKISIAALSAPMYLRVGLPSGPLAAGRLPWPRCFARLREHQWD